ncbi:hypothetical protein HDE_06656 [Halotydeus destructor]|nr:hypothetical protein HDE_06656 [Halotydeus destructor]
MQQSTFNDNGLECIVTIGLFKLKYTAFEATSVNLTATWATTIADLGCDFSPAHGACGYQVSGNATFNDNGLEGIVTTGLFKVKYAAFEATSVNVTENQGPLCLEVVYKYLTKSVLPLPAAFVGLHDGSSGAIQLVGGFALNSDHEFQTWNATVVPSSVPFGIKVNVFAVGVDKIALKSLSAQAGHC